MKSLKSKKNIDKLFSTGKRVYTTDLKGIYCEGDSEVLISAPIKIFKRAVDRNRIKRLIRASLIGKEIGKINLALIYSTSEIKSQIEIEKDINKILIQIGIIELIKIKKSKKL